MPGSSSPGCELRSAPIVDPFDGHCLLLQTRHSGERPRPPITGDWDIINRVASVEEVKVSLPLGGGSEELGSSL